MPGDVTLTPRLLLRAYASGIFPMAESRDDPEIFWVDPRHRGIIPLDGFHMSRSLRRRMRSGRYESRLNSAFGDVVSACADRDETWINSEIYNLYNALHDMGFAHSLEIWDGGSLIGGVYGVALGGAFFGESMFSRATDGSKMALSVLVDALNAGGFTLFDTQFITPHLASLGAIEISRAQYHEQLSAALPLNARLVNITQPDQLLQRKTHTSNRG